jgi:hypothetical protein
VQAEKKGAAKALKELKQLLELNFWLGQKHLF